MTTTHIVHLQPRDGDPIMNPPHTGPQVGPENTSDTAKAMAMPRCARGQQSLSTPPKMVTGATPKRPPKNRPMRTVATLVPSAGIRSKREDAVMPISMGHLRPKRSERGPKIRNPKMYPCKSVSMKNERMKKEKCKLTTSAAGLETRKARLGI